MKMDTMRKLDSYLGSIFCKFLLLLRLFSTLSISQKHPKSVKEPRNILVVKFFGMGTILLASPSLRELKKKYKTAKITIFTLTSNHEICKMLHHIDAIICLDISGVLVF